jgi:hypothetical protein
MCNTIVGAGAVGAGAGAGAASRYGSGSDQKMRLLAASAPQHCYIRYLWSSQTHLSVDSTVSLHSLGWYCICTLLIGSVIFRVVRVVHLVIGSVISRLFLIISYWPICPMARCMYPFHSLAGFAVEQFW